MKFFAGLVALLAFTAFLPGENVDGKITATRVNARLRPELKSPVAFALNKDAALKITRQIGNWVEFEAPANAPVYISAVHIRNGKTTIELNMRTKGEPNAPVWGSLPAGTAVKVEKITRYGWAKIEPPAHLKLYAARFYVAYDVEALKALPAPIVAPEAATEIVTPVAKDAAPEKKLETSSKPDVTPATSVVAVQAEKKSAATEVTKPADKPVEVKKVEVKPADSSAVVAPVVAPASAAAPDFTAREKELTTELENLFAKMDSKQAVKLTGIVVKVPKSNSICTMYALLDGNKNLGFIAPLEVAAVAKLVNEKAEISGDSYKIGNWKAPIVIVRAIRAVK